MHIKVMNIWRSCLNASLILTPRIRFLIIGGLAFFIDTGLLWIISYGLGVAAGISKLISFFIAVSFTYIGNRFYTFIDSRKNSRTANWLINYGSYCISQMLGAGLNVVLFSFLVSFGFSLIFSAIIAAVGGVFVNYLMAKIALE